MEISYPTFTTGENRLDSFNLTVSPRMKKKNKKKEIRPKCNKHRQINVCLLSKAKESEDKITV